MDTREWNVAALIMAAGGGDRAGGDTPKQWQNVAGRRLIDWSIRAFRAHPRISVICVVTQPQARDRVAGVETADGGDTRAASVLAGLNALNGRAITHVLIHDAARPCLAAGTIDAVLAALERAQGAAPGLALTDALWTVADGQVTGGHPREALARAQTPQGFEFEAILSAHQTSTGDAPDDVAVALAAGMSVEIVPGDADNLKVTTQGDFKRAGRILGSGMDLRLGNGFDVHRFGDGDHVTLCGIAIPHSRALQGHSDADVAMHALTDAIYGALAAGDIGRHFPPTDPAWKDVASSVFLEHARALAQTRGYRLGNADVTLICEQPKIAPHADAMAACLASILGVDEGQISVKATTSERLGFTGRQEGIAALASATLVRE